MSSLPKGGVVVRDDPKERLAFFRPASIPGTEVMAAYQSSQPWHMFHERFAFCVCRTGAAGVRYRGKDALVNDGSVLVREPGETHYNTFIATPAAFKTLFIEPPLFLDAARELGSSRGFHFRPDPITQDRYLFRALERLCTSIEYGGEHLEQQTSFAAAITAIAAHAERVPPASTLRSGKLAVERAKAHLKEHFNELVSLDELAAVARVSRFHLVHVFAKETGLPPHAYQMHIRLERARGLLQKGISATRAAATVGFADQSHLARCFKRVMRVTPRDYARTNRTSSMGKIPSPDPYAILSAERRSEAGSLTTPSR